MSRAWKAPGLMAGALAAACALLFATAACRTIPPASPPLSVVHWVTYSDPDLGFSLDTPDVYRADDTDLDRLVFFRYRGGIPVIVRQTDEWDEKRRGLWNREAAVEEIELAGVRGKRYVHDHQDGPFLTRTIAYVIDRGDGAFAVEFRTNRDLDPVQEYILASVRLE